MPYADIEKGKEYRRKYMQAHKAYYKEQNHNSYLKNIIKRRLTNKIYREKHKDEIKVKKRDEWNIKNYGITWEEKQKKIKSQNNKCMICGKEFLLTRNIHVDHDHDTGKIRDILCDLCNGGLGLFKDNIQVLQNAINYLIKWKN